MISAAFLPHLHRTWTETFEIRREEGLAKNLLRFAATGRAYTKHETFDASMPIALQVGLSATLGRLAEALGYRAVYERYLR